MDNGGWGRSADLTWRGGGRSLDLEGVTKDGGCAGIADADDVSSAGDLDGMAMTDDAFGDNTCCVDGGVVQGVDRERKEAVPDDAESCDGSFIEGDGGKASDDDGKPADAFGDIAEGDRRSRVDANEFGGGGFAGRENGELADAELEGAMVASGDVDTKGDAGFSGEQLVAASRALSINSCRMSSLLRAFGESHSLELLVGRFASCLFVESVDCIWGFMVFEESFGSFTFASGLIAEPKSFRFSSASTSFVCSRYSRAMCSWIFLVFSTSRLWSTVLFLAILYSISHWS